MDDTNQRDSIPVTIETGQSIPSGRMMLLFTVMLVTAAGNTAMQSVMPSIGTALGVKDDWISLAYTWSALFWVLCTPFGARKYDQRGRSGRMKKNSDVHGRRDEGRVDVGGWSI